MPPGFQAAQLVHAAGETASVSAVPPGTNAIVLQAETEDHLLLVDRNLSLAGIPHILIREPDLPYDNQATAIGVLPSSSRKKLKKVLSSLPLLGRSNKCSGSNAGHITELKAQPGAPSASSSAVEHEE